MSFWRPLLAMMLLALPALAELQEDGMPSGLDLSGHTSLGQKIETFQRQLRLGHTDSDLFGDTSFGTSNGAHGIRLPLAGNLITTTLPEQTGDLRTLPSFQTEGQYYQEHVNQIEYFTGDHKLSFLGDDEVLFKELTPHVPCPYCVFLGQEPSALEAAAVLTSASLASAPIGVVAQKVNGCPQDIYSSNFALRPLDTCLLPVVALTVSSNNGKDNKMVCSGTIVGPKHVLTAAHCACRGITDVYFGTAVPQFSVGLDWRVASDDNGFDQFFDDGRQMTLFATRRSVQGAPIFFGDEKQLCDVFAKSNAIPPELVPYDIALLPLPSPSFAIEKQSHFSRTAVAKLQTFTSFLLEQSDVVIAGFGPDGNKYRTRQVVKRYARSKVRNISADNISVGAKGRHVSTCSGDSGSGVYTVVDGALVVHGVLSNGMTDCTSESPVSNFASIGVGSDAQNWLRNELSR
ncbi:trypsin-like serine protease [uncultured Tateyamaria sp.]|uniref:trypsin-like serine protease n=1 Tax=uncultured Tateyamaria sp. TaxID=455651 RepID=UPI00262D0427|nr:trypsin-like serine protease [uncultured Tateyamaria sp.]